MTQKKTIHLCLAHMSETGEEMKFINKAFDERWVAPLGPNVDGFEEDLKKFIANRELEGVKGSDREITDNSLQAQKEKEVWCWRAERRRCTWDWWPSA